jgi:hypothetical protein
MEKRVWYLYVESHWGPIQYKERGRPWKKTQAWVQAEEWPDQRLYRGGSDSIPERISHWPGYSVTIIEAGNQVLDTDDTEHRVIWKLGWNSSMLK